MEDLRAVGDRARVSQETRLAVILAGGAGTRMRAADASIGLSAEQSAAAVAGHKALMPIAGRPFLDHQLDVLHSVGIPDIVVVIGPGQMIRGDFMTTLQEQPRGTADAVFCARGFVLDQPFLVLNGDNFYPAAAIEAVASAAGPALAGFDRDDLVATSNIPAGRINAFAVLEHDASGALQRIIEKPSPADLGAMRTPILVSMNLWKFDSRIFDACRDAAPSPRGELELPAAVMLARERGVEFAVVPSVGPVLDLSQRSDIAEVSRRLGAPS
jgi:dTDP-glucose pyrophosphorylase